MSSIQGNAQSMKRAMHKKTHDKRTCNTHNKEENDTKLCSNAIAPQVKFANQIYQINNLIENFRLHHFAALYEVCNAIRCVHFSDLKTCSAWNTCNLTGELCAESIHFVSDGVAYNVHKRFAYFVTCLWLCTHIQELYVDRETELQSRQANIEQSQLSNETQLQNSNLLQSEPQEQGENLLEKAFLEAYEFTQAVLMRSFET
jgi:hypothetical protein